MKTEAFAKEQAFNHLGVFRGGARLCAPTYEQFVGFIKSTILSGKQFSLYPSPCSR